MSILTRMLGVVPEAPKDGRCYVRRDGEWVELSVAADKEVNEVVDSALK